VERFGLDLRVAEISATLFSAPFSRLFFHPTFLFFQIQFDFLIGSGWQEQLCKSLDF
jgi:hypothetical protein